MSYFNIKKVYNELRYNKENGYDIYKMINPALNWYWEHRYELPSIPSIKNHCDDIESNISWYYYFKDPFIGLCIRNQVNVLKSIYFILQKSHGEMSEYV